METIVSRRGAIAFSWPGLRLSGWSQFPFGPAADIPVTHAQGSQSVRSVLHLGRERMYFGQFFERHFMM